MNSCYAMLHDQNGVSDLLIEHLWLTAESTFSV